MSTPRTHRVIEGDRYSDFERSTFRSEQGHPVVTVDGRDLWLGADVVVRDVELDITLWPPGDYPDEYVVAEGGQVAEMTYDSEGLPLTLEVDEPFVILVPRGALRRHRDPDRL